MSQDLSKTVFYRSYAAYRTEDKRRETEVECFDRALAALAKYSPDRPKVKQILKKARRAMIAHEVMPAMRLLRSAGPALDRDHASAFNCAFLPCDSLVSISEILRILMGGTGKGVAVRRQFIDQLPYVARPKPLPRPHVIEDSTDGWVNALLFGLQSWFQGYRVAYDYSRVRPAGSPLRTKGGTASGPGPLRDLLTHAEEIVLGASRRRLRSVEVADIVCWIGHVVVSGGVRRSAILLAGDIDDLEFRSYKDFSLGPIPPHRYAANISVMCDSKPEYATYLDLCHQIQTGDAGEPGILTHYTNACAEMTLRYLPSEDPWTGRGGAGQFCNITSFVLRPNDTLASAKRKAVLAAELGVLQSLLTDFHGLRPGWKTLAEEDRLIGVDMAAQCDAPHISQDPHALAELRKATVNAANKLADYLGINRPARVTCGKPSGNSSQFLGVSSGAHARWASHYVRRVRISRDDAITALFRDAGWPMEEDATNPGGPTVIIPFAVESPKDAILVEQETAIGQLERYKMLMETWMSGAEGHNQSITIYVGPDEWEGVWAWVWDEWDCVKGLSFLPRDTGSYQQAPYTTVSREEWDKLHSQTHGIIDWNKLDAMDTVDTTESGQTCACSAGACELL